MAFELIDALHRHAAGRVRSRPAVSDARRSVTYAELRDRALVLASGLRAHGVRPGDRVGIMLGNRVEHVEAIFAVAALQAVFVPINVLFRGPEARRICADAGVRTLIVDEHSHRAVADLVTAVATVVTVGEVEGVPGAGTVPFDRLTGFPPLDGRRVPDGRRELAYYYTSGSTGDPKGAIHTHETLLHNATQQVRDLALTVDDVFVAVSSLTWAGGFNSGTLPLLLVGGHVVLHPTGGVTIASVVDHVRRTGATFCVIAPTMLRRLALDAGQCAALRESELRLVLSGGEPLPAHVVEDLGRAMPATAFCQGYGLTEFPTLACVLHRDEAVSRAGSTGRATWGTRVAVRTASGDVVDSGEGELLIRSNATMRGYLDRPEETAAAFRDGWLNTGDVVRIDEDGYVSVVDRTKDLIISGALNVYPAEIERVILGLAGVEEVGVVGRPDAQWGEVPVAVVRVGGSGPCGEQILDRCRQGLATYKVPRQVVFVLDELPRTVSGKLHKPGIRDLLERTATRGRDGLPDAE